MVEPKNKKPPGYSTAPSYCAVVGGTCMSGLLSMPPIHPAPIRFCRGGLAHRRINHLPTANGGLCGGRP